MEYFCYSLAALALLYVLGLGLAILIVPESSRQYILILAPWIGYCYAGVAAWPVFYYGGKIGAQTARFLLIPPVVCLMIALVRQRRAQLARTILHRPALGALAIAALGFVVLSIPIFWNARYLTTITLGNNDIAAYGGMSRYLAEFGRLSSEGFVGQMATSPLPFEWTAKDFYFGPAAFVALAGKLLGLMPHQDLSLIAFLLSGLGATVMLMLLRDTLSMSLGAALFGVAFVGFHPMMQFLALEGFFPQVVGIGLTLLLFWGNLRLLQRNTPLRDRVKLCLLLSLFSCGLLLNYPHMLLFVWSFVGLYVVILAVLERSFYGFKVAAVANILVLAATALILPQRIAPFIQIFRIYAAAEAGWFIPWMAPDYVAGLMFKNPFLVAGSDAHLRMALSILVTLVCLAGMVIAYLKGYRKIVALGLTCAVVYAGCFYFASIGRKDGVWGGYKSFKLVASFLPIFGVALVSFAGLLRSRYRQVDLVVKAAAGLIIFTGFAMSDYTMLRPTRFARVESEYEALRGLERTSSVKSINVSAGDYWPTMWVAYFLMHKVLYLENPSYYISSELIGDYDLVDKVSLTSQFVRVQPAETPVIKEVNQRFTLVGPVKRKVRAKLGEGWYRGEVGHIWSGKDHRRASIVLHSLDDGVKVSVTLVCAPLRNNDHLLLQAGGENLNTAVAPGPSGQAKITVPDLVLKKGDTELDLISELEPIQPNATDPRAVSYSFSSIEVAEL